jgi:hypothetical protein
MKLAGIVCLSLLSGIAGGVASRIFFPVPVAQSSNHEIHLADGSSQCDLTSRGLHIKWNDGREIRLDARALDMRSNHHLVTLAASDTKGVDASFLVLDGRVWYAPSSRNRTALLTELVSMGDIDFNQIENDQPK